MRVLVTGANGFVGRALCERLSASGVDVRQAVRSLDSRAGANSVAVGDIDADTDWRPVLEGVDAVVHLAARAHVRRDSGGDRLDAYRRVNVEGTRGIAVAAIAAGVRRFVFLSSVKVHGQVSVQPFSERDPANPQDAYGISKWEAEQALEALALGSSLEWVVLRPPLVYGPGVRANFFSLLQAVARGVPLPLGALDNRRSLLYLGNLIDALVSCLHHPAASRERFVLSDGQDLSTPELVRALARALHVRARLVSVPASLLDLAGRLAGKGAAIERLTGSLQVNSARIQQLLGWRPPYTVEEGIDETAAWYRRASQARLETGIMRP